MRRSTPEPIEAGGQDSFVDVVTNLVGILIVLILIVGVRVKPAGRAGNAAERVVASKSADAPSDSGMGDGGGTSALQNLQTTAAGVEHDIHDTANQITSLEREAARRAVERDRLATLVVASQRVLDEHRDKLASSARADFELRQQASGLEAEVQHSRQELAAANDERRPPIELKHYLTPLSRTVFGKEVHFRLAEGRIVYVPFEELAERAKSEIHTDAGSLSDLTDHVHTVGPFGGFQMEFTLTATPGRNPGEVGIQMNEARFTSLGGNLGELLADAMQPASEFHRRLAQFDASQTTVTVWVYPESFGDYRPINDDLSRLGFAVAARPMPAGQAIGASEHGTRSAAE